MRDIHRARRAGTIKTIGRDLPNGDYIEIEAVEDDGSGGLSPCFAITCMGWEKRGASGRSRSRNAHGMPRDCDFAGCNHEVILEAAPELAPLVTAHLAALDGTPMHGLANAWYYYSGRSSAYEREQIAAGKDYGYSRLLETSDHDRAARALSIAPEDLPTGLDKVEFVAFVNSLTDHWRAQARAARAALDAMVDGDGVEGR